MRLHSVSMYNHEGDCLWLSEGALGPDEHSLVIEAIEALTADKSQPSYELGMEDGRIALFLAIRAPRGDLVGVVMILADMKIMSDSAADRIVTPAVRTILQKIAVLLHKLNPKAAATGQAIAMPGDAIPPPLTAVPTPPGNKALAPKQVDEMLTLELEAEAPAPATPPPAPAAKGKPAAAAAPAAKAGGRTPAAAKGAAGPRAVSAVKAPAAKAPAAVAAPAAAPAPPPAIEVLAFDPNVPLAQARQAPAPAPLPESDVLAFDANIKIPTASPATAAPPPDVEVLAFDVEPPVAQPAPPAKGKVTESAPPAAPQAKAPAAPTRTPPAPAAEPPVAPPAPKAAPKGKAAKTAAAAEDVVLIQDTGPFPKLQIPEADETVLAPVPRSPPPEPMSAADTAGDLMLAVQELIKLRSSGRTRRYEVLARSRRDAARNEVPPAFIAETAKGIEGAALDALVVERLLRWLGQHGEEIWDSEPASFSVNLSIGALEDATFTQRIGQWLKETDVPAEYIGFEITEFAGVQCRPQVQRFVDAVEKLGCFLVIDNFTFDSRVFELLGSKALRHVKIDPKITTAAMKDKLQQALVVAILQACKVLGVHCVAKRIESDASLKWLTAVGCDFAQGFVLEKPTALESLVSGKKIPALRNS